MSEQEMLIDRILSASGIVGHTRRCDVAREMRSHIEDMIEEERAAGRDEKEIERLVAVRFGPPGPIAQEFATVYRSQRIAFSVLSYSLLAIVSVSLVAAFVYAIQYGVVLWLGVPSTPIFARSHLGPESALLVGLTCGYLGLYFAERVFVQKRFAKAFGLVGIAFVIIGGFLQLLGVGGATAIFVGFVFASFVRTLERSFAHGTLRLAGVLIFFAIMGRLAPCYLACSPTWLLFVPVFLAIAVSSQFVAYFAGIFDRRILRRHFAYQ
jgi:hypothetical protein